MEDKEKKRQRKQMQLISELEQMSGPLHEVARVVATYHGDLVKNGMMREEALDLVRDYQDGLLDSLFGPGFFDDDDDDDDED